MRNKVSPTTTLARLFLAGLNRARFSSLTTRAGQVGGGLFFQASGDRFHEAHGAPMQAPRESSFRPYRSLHWGVF